MFPLRWLDRVSTTRRGVRARGLARRLTVEPLEHRRLLTLLGVSPGTPRVSYDGGGSLVSFSPTTFILTATPASVLLPSGPPPVSFNSTPVPTLTIDIGLNSSGQVIGPGTNTDLDLYGSVTLNTVTYSGTLLTGRIAAFGYAANGATADFDFRFFVTGGALESFYAGEDIGVTTTSENSNFSGSFSTSFTGQAKGNIGPITSLPVPSVTTSQQPASATVGTSIADTATVTGNNPTGTVTFNLYNNPNATGTPLVTDSNVPLVGGVATSPGYTTTATGTDYWVATYNGDSKNDPASSAPAVEPVTVTPATPTIVTLDWAPSVTVGDTISDTAMVSGGYNATGTVTFNLYDNPTASGTALFTDADEPLSGGVASSTGYTTTATGTYYWVATYNGDSNNSVVSSGDTEEQVVVGPGHNNMTSPVIETTPARRWCWAAARILPTRRRSLRIAVPPRRGRSRSTFSRRAPCQTPPAVAAFLATRSRSAT